MGIALSKRLICTLSAGALLFAACGGDDDDDATDATDDTTESSERGTLKVCSDMPYEPFEFVGEDDEATGFDIELLRAMADTTNNDLEVIDTDFEGIVLAPAAGTCDVVASALTINDEREEQADFTDPYFDSEQSLLVLKANEDKFGTLEDLGGETIGVQTETTGATYTDENKPADATTKEFSASDEMFLALESGDVAALLQDLPVNGYRATQNPDLVVTETYPTDEQYGFLVESGNTDLLDDLNAALEAVRADDTYTEIYTEWFGQAPAD